MGNTTNNVFHLTLGTIAPVINLSGMLRTITSEAYDPVNVRLFVANYSKIYLVNPMNASIVTSFTMPGGTAMP